MAPVINYPQRISELLLAQQANAEQGAQIRDRIDRELIAARAAGFTYKELAYEAMCAFHRPPMAEELGRGAGRLKQRLSVAMKRVVRRADQDIVGKPTVATHDASVQLTKEIVMANFPTDTRKPRYVREREIFYDKLPLGVAEELVDIKNERGEDESDEEDDDRDE